MDGWNRRRFLAAGAALGLVVQRLAAADLAALGLTLLAIFYADSRSRVPPSTSC